MIKLLKTVYSDHLSMEWRSPGSYHEILSGQTHGLDAALDEHRGLPRGAASRASRLGEVDLGAGLLGDVLRSEERRVGKACSSWWSPYH